MDILNYAAYDSLFMFRNSKEVRCKAVIPDTRFMYYVLACGDSFSGQGFPERDRIRERLRKDVARTGLSFVEHYWVWDGTDRAQLLVVSTPSAQEAERFRNFLERHGIGARITDELPEG